MPLARARCSACSQPLADEPHIHVPMACASCGRQTSLVFAADGQPVDFDAAFAPHRLLTWMAAARRAMASGMPGVAVGSCAGCSMPLVISSKQPVTLPCPHCKNVVQGPAEKLLVDQWPEPWARRSRPAVSPSSTASRGSMTRPPSRPDAPGAGRQPRRTMPRCDARAAARSRGSSARADDEGGSKRRMQLGVRVNGMRQNRPYNVILSLPQGEATLRSDNMMGSSASSSSSLIGVTGIGCAIAVAGSRALHPHHLHHRPLLEIDGRPKMRDAPLSCRRGHETRASSSPPSPSASHAPRSPSPTTAPTSRSKRAPTRT